MTEIAGGNPSTNSRPFSPIEWRTATLYGDLWPRYDDPLFWQSVDLFSQRWLANGEDPNFFRGKRCLDIGCGGGRYSFAMALMGAENVVGVDLSRAGLNDAQRRCEAKHLSHVRFVHGSALNLPLPENEFDFVCCSGVLHHTLSVEKGLREIYRVLKPGGSTYLLLYGSGGLFWPLNSLLRTFATLIGERALSATIDYIGSAPNKRRVFLDDVFVPILETYSLERVAQLLREVGFSSWREWSTARMDHEEDASALIAEMEDRSRLWQMGAIHSSDPTKSTIQFHCANICRNVIAAARDLEEQHRAGRITEEQLRLTLIGEGHHRVIARKEYPEISAI